MKIWKITIRSQLAGFAQKQIVVSNMLLYRKFPVVYVRIANTHQWEKESNKCDTKVNNLSSFNCIVFLLWFTAIVRFEIFYVYAVVCNCVTIFYRNEKCIPHSITVVEKYLPMFMKFRTITYPVFWIDGVDFICFVSETDKAVTCSTLKLDFPVPFFFIANWNKLVSA